MSQTWNDSPLLASGDTLSDSRGYINDAFAALRSSFSGSSAPSSPAPVAGQLFYDTDDNVWKIYNGAAWKIIGDADSDYLGLLPLSAGVSYPLTDDLYCGGVGTENNLKNVADPTAAQDAATKNYCDTNFVELSGDTMTGDLVMGANDITMDHDPDADTKLARKGYVDAQVIGGGTYTGNIDMDDTYYVVNMPAPVNGTDAATKTYVDAYVDATGGHVHDATANDGPRIEADNLDTSSFSTGDFLKVASGGVGFDATTDFVKGDGQCVAGSTGLTNGSWVTCETASFTTSRNNQKVLVIGWAAIDSATYDAVQIDLQIGATAGSAASIDNVYIDTGSPVLLMVCGTETITTAGATTWTLEARPNNTGCSCVNAAVAVIEIA
jgi:hypothetical protein